MYILTELGKATINNLKVPHKQNFEKIWKEFENGNLKVVKDSKIIEKYNTFRITRTSFNDGVRTYCLATEYFKWI